jgi:hypothetical protein
MPVSGLKEILGKAKINFYKHLFLLNFDLKESLAQQLI